MPILLKDNIETGDRMMTTAGSMALEGYRAPRDADVVARLRGAGAVILGKCNLAEWANFRSPHSTRGWSSRGGLTRNPYALERTAGGSSSGSAAATAAAFCVASIGTETDGSVVSPAALNGLVGVKPTVGLASRQGVIPISPVQDTPGVMARRVADAAAVLSVIAGTSPDDPATAEADQRRDDYTAELAGASLKGIRIGVARALSLFHPAMEAILDESVRALNEAGAETLDVEALPVAAIRQTEYEALTIEFGHALSAYLAALPAHVPVHSVEELVAFNRAHREAVMPHFGQELLERALDAVPLDDEHYLKLRAECARLTEEQGLPRLLAEHDLDAVAVISTAPPWSIDLVSGDGPRYTSAYLAAIPGFPNISVPAGYVQGLPVGLSFMGGAWQEAESPADRPCLRTHDGHPPSATASGCPDGKTEPAHAALRRGRLMSQFTTRPEIIGTFGVVASTHWLATAAGMAMLERGGNAFDAAVAAGFALQVVEPHLNGPAGEVPILLHATRTGRTDVICGQGVAPAAATIDAYRDLGLDLVPGTGLLAAVVPGAFDAWMLMLRDHGTMELADVLEIAIGYAENGCALVPRVTQAIATVRDLFLNEWPSSAAVFLPGGKVPEPYRLFRNPTLARTYRRVVEEAKAGGATREARIEAARRAWYRGFVAEAIDHFCRTNAVMDTSGERHRGFLTGDDLANWSASVERPLTYDYHGYTLCKTGPWGQGPVALQQLALLKGFDLADMDPTGTEFVHVVTECAKLAFADREAFYGDPDFVDVPVETLLSDDYNDRRRRLVGDRASLDLRPGTIPGFGSAPVVTDEAAAREYALAAVALGGGELTVARFGEMEISAGGVTRGDTCHVDVIDRWGNMVSATPSGGWLNSSPVIPELGFPLTTRGQMFWLVEDKPASLAPGKRPRTTLTPSLALRDGEPYMAFGTPGGDQQDQWSLHVFLRHVHHGMNLQEAIDSPEFHTAHFPTSFYPRGSRPGHLALEGRFAAETQAELHSRGHDLEVDSDWSLGRVSAATKDGELLKAGANPRFMQGYAVGR